MLSADDLKKSSEEQPFQPLPWRVEHDDEYDPRVFDAENKPVPFTYENVHYIVNLANVASKEQKT